MKLALLLGLVIGLLDLSSAQIIAPEPDNLEVATQPPPLSSTKKAEITKKILAGIKSATPGPHRVSVPYIPCEKGPKAVEHRDGNARYYPKITKYLCDGLPCNGDCEPVSKTSRGRYALAYYITYRPFPRVQFLGWRYVRYETHNRCKCVGCSQFTTFEQCQCQKDCPGFTASWQYPDSFCQWKEYGATIGTSLSYVRGKCTCCKVPRYCPRGQSFSRNECRCKVMP
jgi:hypothetical protein